jgi:hypothetical protein
VSIFSRSILTSHASLLVLLSLSASCNGTEGTLVVRHDAAADAAGGAAVIGENPYVPGPAARWFAQLDGPVDIDGERDAQLFYLDAQMQDASALATLRAQGRHYLCYLSAGSLESFRDDVDQFPSGAVGNQLARYPNERWLDVRDSTVRELMERRVLALSALGCAGIPPSSLAVHAVDTGFDLSVSDALDYARWLAERIHAAGMSAGLSGPTELTSELWPTFDFALAIGCVNGTQCAEYAPFEAAKKTVLHLEIGGAEAAPALCNAAKALGFDALISDAGFTGRCITCSDIL